MERREFIFATGTVAALASSAGAFAQVPTKTEDMHPPKYKALEDATAKCVATGEDCLRHCLGMLSMKDTSMNSTFIVSFAKDVAAVCDFCGQENRKFINISECRACAEACKVCADECRKLS